MYIEKIVGGEVMRFERKGDVFIEMNRPRAREFADQDYTKRSSHEKLECERGIDIDEIVIEDYPEGKIELNIEDWKFFIKKYKITKKQKRYIFLRFWKNLSLTDIGKKCKVSSQTVDQTIRRFINGQNTNN